MSHTQPSFLTATVTILHHFLLACIESTPCSVISG